MESVRRDARAAQEANQSLQDLVLRLQHGASTEAARSTRLRELEIAFELQNNEMQAMQRGKESAADAVQAHAAAWAAANHSDTSSSGNHFPRVLLWRNRRFSAWRTELVIKERVRLCKGAAFRTDDLPHGRRVRGQPKLSTRTSPLPHGFVYP